MKEIPFRWIDKYLIHLKLQEKFYLLFLLPLFSVCVLTLIFENTATKMVDTLYQEELALTKSLIEKSGMDRQSVQELFEKSQSGISISDNGQGLAISGENYSITFQHHVTLWESLTSLQIGILAFTLVISLLGVYYIMTFIGGAMFAMNKSLQTLASGDLTNRMNYFEVRDEFSTIAITIDKVSEREQKLVLSLQESLALMQQISSDLNVSATESASVSDNQQQHLSSLASATEEMAATIREVANLAQEASNETHEAMKVAENGQVNVTQTLSSISALSEEVRAASVAVSELDSNAVKINDIVTAISDISDQTNLLALNAAIEAARAGEQGRGFAVVADEVRALAGRTQQATVEIRAMIEALQSNSHSLTQVMQSTVEGAEDGQTKMNLVQQEISLLASKSQTISDGSTQIATAAEQQGEVAESIAASVEEIRQQSQKVCDVISSTTSQIDGLRQQSDQLETLLIGIKA